jgi:hypothetical protein
MNAHPTLTSMAGNGAGATVRRAWLAFLLTLLSPAWARRDSTGSSCIALTLREGFAG